MKEGRGAFFLGVGEGGGTVLTPAASAAAAAKGGLGWGVEGPLSEEKCPFRRKRRRAPFASIPKYVVGATKLEPRGVPVDTCPSSRNDVMCRYTEPSGHAIRLLSLIFPPRFPPTDIQAAAAAAAAAEETAAGTRSGRGIL